MENATKRYSEARYQGAASSGTGQRSGRIEERRSWAFGNIAAHTLQQSLTQKQRATSCVAFLQLGFVLHYACRTYFVRHLQILCGVYKFDKLVSGMHTQFSIGILLMKPHC